MRVDTSYGCSELFWMEIILFMRSLKFCLASVTNTGLWFIVLGSKWLKWCLAWPNYPSCLNLKKFAYGKNLPFAQNWISAELCKKLSIRKYFWNILLWWLYHLIKCIPYNAERSRYEYLTRWGKTLPHLIFLKNKPKLWLWSV